MLDLIILLTLIGIIILSFAEYRIGLILATLLYSGLFIIYYEMGDPEFYKPLLVTLVCVVMLILTLSISYSRQNRIVV